MWTWSLPTSGSRASISSWVGTWGASEVMPHRVTSGATVTSKAPPVSSARASARSSSSRVSCCTDTASPALSRLMSLVSMVRERVASSRLISREAAVSASPALSP